MRLELPWVLGLAVPWFLLWLWLRRIQRGTVDWITLHVADRFRRTWTVHGSRSLEWHLRLLLVMGLLLIVAAARPTLVGRTDAVSETVRVLVVLDASASMWTDDISDDGASRRRFDQARELARELVERLGKSNKSCRLALVSYSGIATIHLPMVEDPDLVAEALGTAEIHSFYQSTGSSLSGALEIAVRFLADTDDGSSENLEDLGDLQVVLLSDGELPFPESYDAPLDVLVEAGSPVHTVAIGSLEGQTRVIYDFRDVIAKKEEKAVLREYSTRRVDEHLRRIAERSGGRFAVLSEAAAAKRIVGVLAESILRRKSRRRPLEREGVGVDLSRWPLLVFLALFLLDALGIGHRAPRTDRAFDIERLGDPPARRALVASLVLLLAGGCDSPLWRAHRANERGIVSDRLGRHDSAQTHYEWSRVYGIRSEIPTYNLARSLTLRGEHSAAHDVYQEALERKPDFVEALYNDGVTLYAWGAAERDPAGCELERTQDLWRQSLSRFESVIERSGDSSLGRDAEANRDFLAERLAEIDRLVAQPPDDCSSPRQPPPPPPPSGMPPPSGAPPPPPPSADGGDLDSPMTSGELDQIRRELDRIARSGREEGKYFRRTRPEQFSQDSWSNPESEIWW